MMKLPRLLALISVGSLLALVFTGCNTTRSSAGEAREPAQQATTEKKRYRHSTQMGSWFMEKKQTETSEADAAASRAALEEVQRRGMRPVRDGSN